MGSQKIEGFKISEISELARIEFKRNEKTILNHLGKPDKKIKQSVTGNGNASKEQLSEMVKNILLNSKMVKQRKR